MGRVGKFHVEFGGSGRVSGLVGRVGSEVWLELVGRVSRLMGRVIKK